MCLQRINEADKTSGVLSKFARNVGLGVAGGTFFACCFSAYVLVLYFAAGSPAPQGAQQGSLGSVVAGYFASGISIGLLVGILLPLTKWWWGAMIVGAVAGIPLYVAMEFADSGQVIGLDSILTAQVLGFAVTFGSLAGLVLWHVFHKS